MRWSRKAWSLLLCCCLFMISVSPASAWTEYPTGNINNNENIDASDALLALQHSVQLITLSGRGLSAADVSGDGKVNASDALLILQYSVNLIEKFPNDMTGEEKYYNLRDAYYNATGEDFIDNGEVDLNDVDSILETYGQVIEPSDVELAEITESGTMVYTPLSDAAAETGTLHKYDNAEKVTGTLELDGTVLHYSMPTNVTAYDMIPIEYSVSSLFPAGVHFSANTFEETDRYAEPDAEYYDCNIPNNVDLEITYNGYVIGNNADGYAPTWKYNYEDIQGTQYPAYDTSELIRSGTMPAGNDYLWLNFSFKNIGDTILDGEGNGSFMFEPLLYKKNAQGKWEQTSSIGTVNRFERLYDYLYPGEEGDVWLLCLTDSNSYVYSKGEYRLTLRCDLRNERDGTNWQENFSQGRAVMDASFDFTVTADGTMTEPGPITYVHYDTNVRNAWLASFEEFQSSFQLLDWVSSDEASPTTGVMYVQPSPWSETVTLKISHGNFDGIDAVHIPITVESDSLSIELNPYNNNYHINEDGTREPILMTQSMIDMRGNVQMGPDALSTGVNDLLNMKDAGINMLNSTMAYAYDFKLYDSYKFMMDCSRVLGFDFEAFSHYPYNYSPALSKAAVITRGNIPNPTIGSFGYSGMNQANGILAKFNIIRYGDLLWTNGDGVLPIAAEDTRGWLTITHDWRFGIATDQAIYQYQDWLKTVYTDITELNAAYGSNYGSFDEIDPRTEGMYEDTHMGAYTHTASTGVFQEHTRAMAELDVYRTLARINDYKEMLATTDANDTETKFWIRYEGSTYLAAGIDPNTTNPLYRQYYWEQRRNALIPELLAASDVVFGGSNYDWYPASPTEVYEMTKHSTQSGMTISRLGAPARLGDYVINTTYGDPSFVDDLNLADTSLKGVKIDCTRALYPYLKAIYEGGGIPGVMWQDYHCEAFITSTQYKELQFYTQKIQEMLATEDGKEWATNFESPARNFEEDTLTLWSYPQEYIEMVLEETPRDNHFENPYVKAQQ